MNHVANFGDFLLTSRCPPAPLLLHHILSLIAYTFRENRVFVFSIIVQLMMSWDSRVHFGLRIVFICLYITSSHYHHCANLSEDIDHIKCLSDIFCRVCEWDLAYSLSYSIYNIWGCVFSVYPFPLWWLKEYILCLIVIISEVWTITHCLGSGHETMVCAVCLAIFLCLIWIFIDHMCWWKYTHTHKPITDNNV